MYAKKKNGVKLVALVLVLALLVGGAIGGTLAWLIAETNPIVNTFTVGNISITLTETLNAKSNGAESNDIWQGKMVPGTELLKDPQITVAQGSEKCWLFVKIEETGYVTVDQKVYVFNDFVTYVPITDWEEVESGTNYKVYGFKTVVDASSEAQTKYVLQGSNTNPNGCVSIPQTVTKEMMDAVHDGQAPKLTFTAYAIQSDNLKKDGNPVSDVNDAWSVYKNPPQENNSNP